MWLLCCLFVVVVVVVVVVLSSYGAKGLYSEGIESIFLGNYFDLFSSKGHPVQANVVKYFQRSCECEW